MARVGLSHKRAGDWAKNNPGTWKVVFYSYQEDQAYKGPDEVFTLV
jgi:hypothetical protein